MLFVKEKMIWYDIIYTKYFNMYTQKMNSVLSDHDDWGRAKAYPYQFRYIKVSTTKKIEKFFQDVKNLSSVLNCQSWTENIRFSIKQLSFTADLDYIFKATMKAYEFLKTMQANVKFAILANPRTGLSAIPC